MKREETLLKGLAKFVEERNIKKVRLLFEEFHASDIYIHTKDWPIEKIVLFLRLLTEDEASELFAEMEPEQQTKVIDSLTTEEIAELFEEMYTDEAIDVLEDLPAKITSRVLKAADSETRDKINKILRYDKNTVGYHMVLEFVSLTDDLTIKQSKASIKKQINKDDLEIVGNIFVYNKKTEKFMGYVQPDDIFAGEDNEKITTYLEKITPLTVSEHFYKAQTLMTQYDIPSMPVLDSKQKIVGVIEAEDVIEKYKEADEAAYERAAIISNGKAYLESKVTDIFKARVPWLISLLIFGSFSQIVITAFQLLWAHHGMFSMGKQALVISMTNIATLSVFTALSVSSSITGTAGNSGSQTSSTLVRAIALGEIGPKGTYAYAMKKEFFASILIATVIFFISFVRIIVVWACYGYFGSISSSKAGGYLMIVALVASLTFFITIMFGNFIGTALPLMAHKFGTDGAIFSGPVQTTIVDLTTIIIYFALTSAIFIPISETYPVTSNIKSISSVMNLYNI